VSPDPNSNIPYIIGNKRCGLAIYIKKYLKAKEEELWKLKYFTIHAKIKSSKNPSKRNQNPSRYYNSITTNLKFQHNLAKISSFKNPHIIKIDLLLLLPSRGQNPISYYTL
jgi:hypothetical protein